MTYRGVTLTPAYTAKQLADVASDYEAMILSILKTIVARYDRNPAYPWIDTKFSLVTGEDYPVDDPIRGLDTVYGWIQGRALEALVGHVQWLRTFKPGQQDQGLIADVDRIIAELSDQIFSVWEQNGGHFFFSMTPDGKPFVLDAEGNRKFIVLSERSPYNISDLFVGKGMYAAAWYLNHQARFRQARQYCLATADALFQGTYVFDQASLDSANKVESVPHRHSHFMIEIGTAALMAECEQSDETVQLGLDIIEHTIKNHINLDSRCPELNAYDFFEFCDDHARPYVQNGQIISDPGHALEFVGLTLKFCTVVKKYGLATERQRQNIAEVERLMPHVLLRNFANGFRGNVEGICKTVDLLSGQPVNSDMPWWPLPETIRAALECMQITETRKDKCSEVFIKSHNAFINAYVRPELDLAAVQTRAVDGSDVDVIPATPDADPGYHTSLSLLDCLPIIRNHATSDINGK